MEYKKRYISATEFVWEQVYPNGTYRTVSAVRPALQEWIGTGNVPAVIPYVPAPLPDLATYKAQKKRQIGQECISRIMANFNADDVISVLFDISFFTSRAARLINKKDVKGQNLTDVEAEELAFLEQAEAVNNGLRNKSDLLKSYVDACTTHAEVDAIVWGD